LVQFGSVVALKNLQVAHAIPVDVEQGDLVSNVVPQLNPTSVFQRVAHLQENPAEFDVAPSRLTESGLEGCVVHVDANVRLHD
jgi:hypothetical protein